MAERTNANMLFANFNQDFSYVALELFLNCSQCQDLQLHLCRNPEGVQHYQLRSIWTRLYYEYVLRCFSCFYSLNQRVDDGARGIVEMLFCTSLIALVGAADQPQSSPRKLQIVNTKVRL